MTEPIEAELPDGTVLEFPPGTDPKVIQSTVKKRLGVKDAPAPQPVPQKSAPTLGDRLIGNATALAGGFLRGGPLGMAAAGTGAAMKSVDDASYAAGGHVTDQAAKVMPQEAAAAVGTVVNTAIPSVVGSQLAKVVSPHMRQAATGLMQSALKPSMKALKLGKGDEAVKTMLDEGINVSRGGVEKLHGKIDDLADAISSAIKGSGATVDKGAVAGRIQDVVKRVEASQATPQDALKNIEKVYEQFMTNGLIPKDVPVQQAQRIKQGIYQMLREQYGKLGSETVEAQKAIARGFKEELAAKIPEISQLNAQESKLLNAMALAEHRALQAGNHNPLGLSLLAHGKGSFGAFLADRSPLFKSILARILNSGKENIPSAVGAAAGGLSQTVQSKKQ